MDNVKKGILTILGMLAVMAYTVWNYIQGKADLIMFLVCMAILGIPMMNIINLLIQEMKKK